MIARVPSMALGSPPLTGASKKSIPFAAHAAPIFCETIGLMELISTRMQPRRAPSKMPDSPSTAASTSGPSGSIVMTISDFEATSEQDAPRTAPFATTSSTEPRTISYTISWCPAFSKLFAMGRPIIPRPMNPIVDIRCSS